MTRKEPQPNAEQLSQQASEKVMLLYTGDQIAAFIENQAPIRDQIWEHEAQQYPAFSEQIRTLRQRLKLVEEVKMQYPSQKSEMKRMFSSVSDPIAQQFLRDILFSRCTAEGKLDDRIDYATEADNMAAELGFHWRDGGWQSWKAKNLSVQQVTGAILQGLLRVDYQPPLPPSSARRP